MPTWDGAGVACSARRTADASVNQISSRLLLVVDGLAGTEVSELSAAQAKRIGLLQHALHGVAF